MARGRVWTPEEDEAIRTAARENGRRGIKGFRPGDIEAGRRAMHGPKGYMARLEEVAEQIGRTYAAVRKRASRLQAASYRT